MSVSRWAHALWGLSSDSWCYMSVSSRGNTLWGFAFRQPELYGSGASGFPNFISAKWSALTAISPDQHCCWDPRVRGIKGRQVRQGLTGTVYMLNQKQNGCYLTDEILKCISWNEKLHILIRISWKVIPKGWCDNKSSLVKVITWLHIGDRSLPEPITVQFDDTW